MARGTRAVHTTVSNSGALMQSLAGEPSQKAGKRVDQQQYRQSCAVTCQAIAERTAKALGLQVPKALFDLHALRIDRHDLGRTVLAC